MEIREILKSEQKKLNRCQRVLQNVKAFYWKSGNEEIIDITQPGNENFLKRIEIRGKISECNKRVGGLLAKRLQYRGAEIEQYMGYYWTEILLGFVKLDEESFDSEKFRKTFLANKDSKYYRRFTDCISVSTMTSYLKYLRLYNAYLEQGTHKEALVQTIQDMQSEDVKVRYTEPMLPKKWSEINKQIEFLRQREDLEKE